MSDISRWELERVEVAARIPTTNRIAIVTAWAPTHRFDSISKKVEEAFSINAVEILNPEETETIPSNLKNSSLVKPFESVTNLYGAPFYHDLDPTPALSLFFVLFFGFCLSDAGYGLFLMLVTGLILWRYHLDPGTKDMIKLLFYGGVSTAVMGALFGGYFGVSPADIASQYPSLSFLKTLQGFDPINDPMPVFFFAIILGFIHLAFGIFLNLYLKIKPSNKCF
jgi:V/A-type H+-transporting ATPase subunit I